MGRTKQIVPKESIEDIVAKAIAAEKAQTASKGFFHLKSIGMWSALGTLIVACIAIFGSINGCFETKFQRDQRISDAWNKAMQLDRGDSIIMQMINRNYWYFYGLHRQDSAQISGWRDDMLDSCYDLRSAINQKRK